MAIDAVFAERIGVGVAVGHDGDGATTGAVADG